MISTAAASAIANGASLSTVTMAQRLTGIDRVAWRLLKSFRAERESERLKRPTPAYGPGKLEHVQCTEHALALGSLYWRKS